MADRICYIQPLAHCFRFPEMLPFDWSFSEMSKRLKRGKNPSGSTETARGGQAFAARRQRLLLTILKLRKFEAERASMIALIKQQLAKQLEQLFGAHLLSIGIVLLEDSLDGYAGDRLWTVQAALRRAAINTYAASVIASHDERNAATEEDLAAFAFKPSTAAAPEQAAGDQDQAERPEAVSAQSLAPATADTQELGKGSSGIAEESAAEISAKLREVELARIPPPSAIKPEEDEEIEEPSLLSDAEVPRIVKLHFLPIITEAKIDSAIAYLSPAPSVL